MRSPLIEGIEALCDRFCTNNHQWSVHIIQIRAKQIVDIEKEHAIHKKDTKLNWRSWKQAQTFIAASEFWPIWDWTLVSVPWVFVSGLSILCAPSKNIQEPKKIQSVEVGHCHNKNTTSSDLSASQIQTFYPISTTRHQICQSVCLHLPVVPVHPLPPVAPYQLPWQHLHLPRHDFSDLSQLLSGSSFLWSFNQLIPLVLKGYPIVWNSICIFCITQHLYWDKCIIHSPNFDLKLCIPPKVWNLIYGQCTMYILDLYM